MARARRDPFPGFQFVVEIDGIAAAGFREVSGLEGEIDVVEYREGADATPSARKLPGLVRYANVTLHRGLTDSNDLYQWWRAVASGKPDRRAAAIVFLDGERNPVRRWTLRDAWPARYAVSPLDAGVSGVVVETLELAHEGFDVE
ncbi:MAG TPA: phage tail protein [Gaiellaceae bacterium]|nr:phage tail protein [Gaiellaceae bacterium]